MSRPAEFIEIDGLVHSWYCTVCGKELGADLDERDGMPVDGCPVHGAHALAWDTWNAETDPTYPHRVVRGTYLTPYIGAEQAYGDDEDPEGWCPQHQDWYDECPCYVSPTSGAVYPPLPADYRGGPIEERAL
ncbi:hypothetical protein SEA_FIZZLES_2 [Microbacterium phage Fizzles]|nr:hypothetical protein SEA_FIZZLES_2 [Microbacterium phage Fizzles]